MAVNLSNKYQSPERRYIRQIGGIDETSEKMTAENLKRQYGGVGEVWFQGNSAAGSSTGGGGGDTGTTDPNGQGGGGSGGSGGGSGGGGSGGGSGVCECVEVSLAGGCCVSGYDCETGQKIQLQLQPSGSPIFPCQIPPPPPYGGDDTIVIEWKDINCGSYFTTHYELADMDGGAGVAEDALQQSLNTYLCILSCGAMSAGDKVGLATASKNGKSFQYYREQIVQSEQCGNFAAYCNVIIQPNQQQYNAALENWGKNAALQYFVKDGKFYDACDPYGKPPRSEPITMCDNNGNQYSVSPDGTITKIEQ